MEKELNVEYKWDGNFPPTPRPTDKVQVRLYDGYLSSPQFACAFKWDEFASELRYYNFIESYIIVEFDTSPEHHQ